jgi:hypothetical protein
VDEPENGWIQWHGGECPVEAGMVVDVYFDGGRWTQGRFASNFIWTHEEGSVHNVVAYQVSIHTPLELQHSTFPD